MIINSIHSAYYDSANRKIFVVDCNLEVTGNLINYPRIEYVFGENSVCDSVCSTWEETDGNTVTPYAAPNNWAHDRREKRTEVFKQTLDRLNTVWWNSLTEEQQTEVQNFRQAWLDYPSDETLEEPEIPSVF